MRLRSGSELSRLKTEKQKEERYLVEGLRERERPAREEMGREREGERKALRLRRKQRGPGTRGGGIFVIQSRILRQLANLSLCQNKISSDGKNFSTSKTLYATSELWMQTVNSSQCKHLQF